MCFEKLISLILFFLHTWTESASGVGQSALWSVKQHDGKLDELYFQTQTAAPVTPDYEFIPTVCTAIKTTNSFKLLTQDNGFRSKIRGRLTEVENSPAYVTEFGSRRYELKKENVPEPLAVDLYTCTDEDPSRIYLLSYGYEHDSLFFLFILDVLTNEAELRALVQGDHDDSPEDNTYSDQTTAELEGLLKQYVKTNILRNPLCDLTQVQRVKACLLLLNTPYYANKYILSPTVLANYDPKCKRITLESGSALDRPDEYALPCWVRPISNPWIKVLFLPDAPSLPLYISVNYRSFDVKTFKTIHQDDEVDTVSFDANFIDLFLKDLFFIFKEAATQVKKVPEFIKGRQNKDQTEVQNAELRDKDDSPAVTTNTVDRPIDSVHGN